MGLMYTPVTISNPADHSMAWESNFLVDTGAMDSLVPRDCLESIGITPKGQREYVLADGREVTSDIAPICMDIMGEIIGATILFGEDASQPLLGRTAMLSAGIEVDPHNHTFTKLPSRLMVGFRRR